MNNDDLNHLDLLAVFHYVVGGLIAFFSCTPFIHVFLGVAMVTGNIFGTSTGAEPPPFVGWIFVIMGSVFIVLGWSMATCIVLAGRKLKQHKSHTFCMVIAGIECLFMPFGTILGVFTLIILSKESIKAVFAEQKQTLES